jgi:hypothetical protein
MSTGAEAIFIQRRDCLWYYRLQRYPYGENPLYDAHGPFDSLELAKDHLHSYYSNPGGCGCVEHAEDNEQ